MIDLEKPIVTSDGRHAVLVSQDVPGDKQFLVAFENEVTGELTSGTFNRVQLQEQFRNKVVPETFIYEIVLGPEGVPLLVAVNGQDDVLEGSHCVAVTILGEQATEVSLLDGTGKPEGWAKKTISDLWGVEGGQEEATGLLGAPPLGAPGEHAVTSGYLDVVRTVPAEDAGHDGMPDDTPTIW